jgi:hypothetical protein
MYEYLQLAGQFRGQAAHQAQADPMENHTLGMAAGEAHLQKQGKDAQVEEEEEEEAAEAAGNVVRKRPEAAVV